MMTEEDVRAGRKQRLCQKYDISEHQLDFSYVNTCSDPKILEKILKILRSNEEGSYPQLEKATEAQLQKLCANSRLLITEQPACSWDQLPKEEQEQLSRDFLDLGQASDARSTDAVPKAPERYTEYPPIRNSGEMLTEKPPLSKKPLKSCAPRSLESWDKFDVEKALSLVDRPDELKSNARIRANNESKIPMNVSGEAIQDREVGAGDACSKKSAIEEKTRGNDFYNASEYDNALRHYNNSLKLAPLPEVYNNRAQVYLRMHQFELALADCDKVLQMTEGDVKAYFRRSKALLELNRFQEAYESIEKALHINPHDSSVQDLANKIREKLKIHPSSKKVRIGIRDVEEERKKKPYIEEFCPRENIYYPFTRPADNINLNDIGTARLMCRCNGGSSVPPFLAKLRSAEDPPHTNRLYLRKARSKKSPSDRSLASRRSKKAAAAMNGEIIEKDTIEAGEKAGCKNESATRTYQSNLAYCLSVKDLKGVAKEMSALHASQLSKALSDQLDSTTLNLCVMALCGHLKSTMESMSRWKLIQEHLIALSHFPQFKSAVKSLHRNSKKALSATFAAAEREGQRVADVSTLYELNGAMPPPS